MDSFVVSMIDQLDKEWMVYDIVWMVCVEKEKKDSFTFSDTQPK